MIITIIMITAVVLIAAVLLAAIVWQARSRRFRPSADKQKQQMDLNADLEEAGFAYDIEGDFFYSLMYCWQREVGYCRLYDEAAPLFNMIMDCEPVTFSYDGKRWLIELWKGQYGITTGGEIGVYNTDREDIDTEQFKGAFYETARDNEQLKMSFVLRRKGKIILSRQGIHWWLTGFKLGEFSQPDALTMDAKITFPDKEMRDAFIDGLFRLGYRRKEFAVRCRTVSVHYTRPHSPQPEARNRVQETLVQQTNSNNCRLYEFATGKYSDTLDKVEYLKAMMPELYTIFIDSLYARGIYEAFGWIKDWLEGHHPNPGPESCPTKPPCPPCPPEPPCEPCPPCPGCEPCPMCPPCGPESTCGPEPSCHSETECPAQKPFQPCGGKGWNYMDYYGLARQLGMLDNLPIKELKEIQEMYSNLGFGGQRPDSFHDQSER